MRNAAARIHSPQKNNGKLAWNRRARATSRRCRCFLSTTQFCCGVETQLRWWTTPCSYKKNCMSLDKNSDPLSERSCWTWQRIWVWTRAKKDLRCVLASNLYFMRKIQVHLLKSSTVDKKYWAPDKDGIEKRSHISQCINSKGVVVLLILEEKGNCDCLARGQILHLQLFKT